MNEFGRFSCLCDEPWSGDTCQVALDFCMGHKCGNGAKCVNQPEYRNYSCACTAGYSGILCERPVGNYIIIVFVAKIAAVFNDDIFKNHVFYVTTAVTFFLSL